MKEVRVQFASGRQIVISNVVDYVESEDFDVLVTNEDEHITLFKNQIEYMVVEDIETEIRRTRDELGELCSLAAEEGEEKKDDI